MPSVYKKNKKIKNVICKTFDGYVIISMKNHNAIDNFNLYRRKINLAASCNEIEYVVIAPITQTAYHCPLFLFTSGETI